MQVRVGDNVLPYSYLNPTDYGLDFCSFFSSPEHLENGAVTGAGSYYLYCIFCYTHNGVVYYTGLYETPVTAV